MKKIIITFALIIASMTAHAQLIPKVYRVKHEMDKKTEIVDLYAEVQFIELTDMYMHGEDTLNAYQKKRVTGVVTTEMNEFIAAQELKMKEMLPQEIEETTGRLLGYIIFIEYIQ